MKTLKIIKISGNIIDNDQMLEAFLAKFSRLKGPKILVHGGGKQASELSKQLGVKVKMTNGRRITDADTLDVITMIYAGKINKNIVAKLQAMGCNSIGFSGADGNCIVSKRRPVKDIDYGYVGDVEKVNIDILELLLKNGITPVFCAITHDESGQLYNTNADTIASELAIGSANTYRTELYYCFEKDGVLMDKNDENSVLKSLDSKTYKLYIDNGIISDGMLPKLKNSFNAINNKVEKVCIGKPEMLFQSNSNFTTIEK